LTGPRGTPRVAVVQNGDAVLDTLVLADQPRAGNRLVVAADAPQDGVAAVQLLAQGLEALDGLALQVAIGQFLDAVG
jgi:hypothetical protein